MKILSFDTVSEVADYAADILIKAIKEFKPTQQKKYLVLGLPTGSTPIPVYERLVRAYQNGEISYEEALKLSAFTNTASPLFMIGVVGTNMLQNTSLGLLLIMLFGLPFT